MSWATYRLHLYRVRVCITRREDRVAERRNCKTMTLQRHIPGRLDHRENLAQLPLGYVLRLARLDVDRGIAQILRTNRASVRLARPGILRFCVRILMRLLDVGGSATRKICFISSQLTEKLMCAEQMMSIGQCGSASLLRESVCVYADMIWNLDSFWFTIHHRQRIGSGCISTCMAEASKSLEYLSLSECKFIVRE